MDNKTFLTRLSRRMGCDTRDAAAMVAALSAVVRDECGALHSIAVPGFGTFTGIKHEETVSTDLTTGRRLLLPPQIVLSFTPGSKLRKEVENG